MQPDSHDEPDAESLLHAWFFFEHSVPLQMDCRGDQLLLAKQNPYRSYDMNEQGEARVGPAQPRSATSGYPFRKTWIKPCRQRDP